MGKTKQLHRKEARVSVEKSSPPTILQGMWSWPVVGSVVLFVLGLGVSFMIAKLPLIADLFFLGSGVLFSYKFFTWELPKNHKKKWLIRIETFVICLFLVGGSIYGNHYLNVPINTTASKEIQFEQFKELHNLFGNFNETGLRDIFGFSAMLALNISVVMDKIKNKNFDINKYTTNGRQLLINTKIAGYHIRRQAGGVVYHVDPSQVSVIVLPMQYIQGQKLILHYKNSPTLPTIVVDAIKEFESTINNNATLLIEVLNETFQKNFNYYLHHDDINSPYWGIITSIYWRKFAELRPKAEKIIKAISQSQGMK